MEKGCISVAGVFDPLCQKGELYIGSVDENIVSCMVLNHECNDGYKKIKWTAEARDSDVLVIHALGVAPLLGGRGIAKDMEQKAFDIARERHIKAIRLDVLRGNIPAVKVYTKMGFRYRGTVQMFYEDTGWTDFEMFEYIV